MALSDVLSGYIQISSSQGMAYMHWPLCSRQRAVPYTPYSTRYHVITNTYCKFTCSCCYTHCAYLQCTCTCIYSENAISVTVAGHDCLVNTYMYVPQCTLMHVTCMCWLCMYMYIHGHDVGLHVQCACTCTCTCIYILCSQTTMWCLCVFACGILYMYIYIE